MDTPRRNFPDRNLRIPKLETIPIFSNEIPCCAIRPFLQSSLRAVSIGDLLLTTSSSPANSRPIEVLIADSNRMQAQLLISALRRRQEFNVTACQMEIVSILRAVNERLPRVALLSVNATANMADAVMTLRRFHLSYPDVRIVLLVESCERESVVNAFRSGARGIFSITDANLRLLRKCLLRVAAGQIWANTEQLNYILELISEVPSLRVLNSNGNNLLTPREEQVVALVAEGLGNRQIAVELGLSEHTVKKYLFRIFEKLGISTRVELVLYAMNHGEQRQAEWLAGSERVSVPDDALDN